MRYYLDTEFIEDGRTIELISIGIVSDDGREFYAEAAWFDADRANDWVKQNVFPHLGPEHDRLSRKEMRENVLDFMTEPEEVWTYYGSYDWVVLCQLFGLMVDLPKGWPMFTCDLKQWAKRLHASTKKVPKEGNEHNALDDARWNKKLYDYLLGRENKLIREKVEAKKSGMRRFELNRKEDPSGVSGVGVVAEGAVFSDGRAVTRWLTATATTIVYDTIEDVLAIHGHGGATELRFIDE